MASSRDSSSIRASVYDVFVELGAFDDNSRVAEWIFTDPTFVLPDPDEVVFHRENRPVRFIDRESPRGKPKPAAQVEASPPRPTSPFRSLGHGFSTPKRIRSRKSRTDSTSISSSSRSPPSGDGYDTDEGYASASQNSTPKSISRVRKVFSHQPTTKSTPPAATESPTKPLPPLPTIRERLRSSAPAPPISLTKSASIFRKRAKSPVPEDDLEQWHEVAALSPRVFNPSVENGVPLVAPAPVPPSAFRQLITPSRNEDHPERPPSRGSQRLSFALPRGLFHSLSVTKRRVTPREEEALRPRRRPRPQSLDLPPPQTPRFATSLPSSPFILVTEDGVGGATTPDPRTPFVFVSAIDNPTPLNSAAMRRFSDVTSMTASLYPLSIARTLRRSMVFDQAMESPALSPSLRPSSSYSSLHERYALYDQPIPAIQRGKEAPFPARPVLPQPLSAGESRAATIQRYREFSEQLVELTQTPTRRPA